MSNADFYGWKLVAAFFFMVFVNLGFPAYGSTVLNTAMALDLRLNREALGLLFAVYMFMSGLPAPLAALCVNRRGVRFTLVLGSLLIIAGALVMALFVNSVATAVVAIALIGLGAVSGGALPAQTGVTRWFQRRRARALAVVLSALGVGGFIAPGFLNYVMATAGTWRAGWWVFAALSTAAALVALLFVRERPADLNQFPDGIRPVEGQEATAAAASEKRSVHLTQQDWSTWDGLRSPTFWLLLLCAIGISCGYTLVLGHAVAHLQDLGHAQVAAGFSLSVLAVGSLSGHFLVALAGDRIEPRFLWSAAIALFGTGLLIFANATGAAALYGYAACVGLGWGVSITCLMTILANYFGTRAYPGLVSITVAVQPTVASLAPYLAGKLYDQSGSYDSSIYTAAALCFAGALLLLWVRPPMRREHLGASPAQSAAP